MGHQSLGAYFKTNFSLMQHHKWSLTELDDMMPWEKQIYIDLLQEFLKEEEKRIQDLENQRKAELATLKRRRM